MALTFLADFRQFPDIGEVRADIVWALNQWQAVLRNLTNNAGNTTIRVRVVGGHIDMRPYGRSAMCVSNCCRNFPHAIADLWYPSALADQLEDRDLQPGSPDMTAQFDLDHYRWNIGSGAPQPDELDLRSIALHKIGHGLGFVSLFWEEGGNGSINGNNLKNRIPDSILDVLGFDLPDFGTSGSVFDSYLVNGVGVALRTMSAAILGATLTDVDAPVNFHDGSVTERVLVTCPFKPLTSILHLNSNASLMRHGIGPGQRVTIVDQPVQSVLGRLGWR